VTCFRSVTHRAIGWASRPPYGACAAALVIRLMSPVAATAQTVKELQVTPETMTLTVGQKQPIFAAAYDRQGSLIPSAKFIFRSSDTTIASVSREGVVHGIGPGLAKIEARLQGKHASLAVLVNGSAGSPAGGTANSLLTLDPAAILLLPGESIRITALALREDGTPLPAGRIAWKSLKPEIATVDTGGVVTGVAAGKSIVQAGTAGGLMATAPVDVEPAEIALSASAKTLGPDEVDTLHVHVPSQNNREIHDGIQWESSDTSVATVGPDGVVRAVAPGRTEIVARGFGQERHTPVAVHRLPQTLVISPKPGAEALLIPLRATRKFSAVAEAADSTPIPEVRVAWEVGDTTIAGFDRATGTLIARATGPTTLTARLRGFEAVVWNIQIVPGVLALDRGRIGLGIGERATLGAVLLQDDGTPIGPADAIEWKSSRPEVAAVTAGEVRGVGPGHAQVAATAPWGKTVDADVFVTADLIVASDRAGSFGLYQVRASGSDTLVPLVVDGGGNVQGRLSPDRTRLVYSSTRSGSYDLYVADADGRNGRRITVDPGSEGEPVWTPDGSRIIYTSSPRGVVPQLMSVKADGTDPRPLTNSAGGNRLADISPDGQRIAFVSTRDGNSEIYEMGIEGGEAHRLTKTGERESSPHYLPNGDLIFVVERGNSARVMRLAAGTGSPQALLQIDKPVVALAVSRDGERIAYVAGKLSEPGKNRSQLTLRIQALAAGSTPLIVPLHPGEQVLSPAF
jgi:uncharacterized protein YjdB